MLDERIRHIIVENVVSVDLHAPVSEAMRLFASHPLHHLPVTDGTVLRGMLSSADMLKLEHFRPRGGAGGVTLIDRHFRIETLMRSPVITAMPDDTIEAAASRMVLNGVHALPVVDRCGQLLGIVTTSDIMHALLHGIGTGGRGASPDAVQRPGELQLRRALAAVESAVLCGKDADGVAATLLYLHRRNGLLETLRTQIARYLRVGQDERLHASLQRQLERCAEPGEATALETLL